jgi:hypothetical protein
MRGFGPLGFAASAAAFGLFGRASGSDFIRGLLIAAAACLVWVVAIKADSVVSDKRVVRGVGSLLRRRAIVVLNLTAMTNVAAITALFATLGHHVDAIGLPSSVTGGSLAIGMLVEVTLTLTYRRFSVVSSATLLRIAYLFSAVRCLGMAYADTAVSVVLLISVQFVSAGLFYPASVAFLESRVPSELRGTGQGLFASSCLAGSLIGFAASNVLYDQCGPKLFFGVTSILVSVAALAMRDR